MKIIKVKTCFIGFGKRVKTFYYPILTKLNQDFDIVGYTNRSNIKNNNISIPFYAGIQNLINQTQPNLIILSVPGDSLLTALRQVPDINAIVLVDTPVTFNIKGFNNLKIFALEQWPYLPIEQFKKILIDSKILGNVFYAENDGRTFEYHGIAQLRNYFPSNKLITNIYGTSISRPEETWNISTVKFSDNTGFLYKFSYFAKKSKFRTNQMLKTYLNNGSIISGCLHSKGYDYEIFKISKNNNGDVSHLDVDIKRNNNIIDNKDTSYHSGNNYYEIESISCTIDNNQLIWNNPFVNKKFNDQEIAIATIFINTKKLILNEKYELYSAKKAFEDLTVIRHIQSL